MIRTSQIYISSATRRHLKMIALAEYKRQQVGTAIPTADEMGERLLSETIAQRYPALAALQKEIDVIEAAMVESMLSK